MFSFLLALFSSILYGPSNYLEFPNSIEIITIGIYLGLFSYAVIICTAYNELIQVLDRTEKFS